MAVRSQIARTLSEKIKRGIRRARKAGKQIGAHGRHLAALHRAEAMARALPLLPIVEEFRSGGATYRDMVRQLNARGAATPSGAGRWHVKTLQRLVERARDADPLLHRSAAAVRQAQDLQRLHREARARTDALIARTRSLVQDLRGPLPTPLAAPAERPAQTDFSPP